MANAERWRASIFISDEGDEGDECDMLGWRVPPRQCQERTGLGSYGLIVFISFIPD
jgi:hypothetical protein